MKDRPRADVGVNTRNDAIQGLRGVAALLVVVTHSILTLTEKWTDPQFLQQIAYSLGEAGVQIFFLISGFIMATTTEGDFASPGSAAQFMRRRLIRIVPIYWLTTAAVVLKLAVTSRVPAAGDVLRSFAFIPYRNAEGWLRPVYGLGWTLNYEMFFYALFALALLQRRSLGLVFLLASLSLFVAAGYVHISLGCYRWSCDILWFYQNPIILYFGGGILLALLREWLQRRRLLPRIDAQIAIVFALVVAICYGLYTARSGKPALVPQVLACVTAATVCALSGARSSRGWFAGVARHVGDASYSIYLTHSFLVRPAAVVWILLFGGVGLVPFVILMMIGCSLLGVLSFRLAEKPALEQFKRRRPLALAAQ